MDKKSTCIVGLGYIGLPVAALLASRGNEVIGLDVLANVIEATNAGKAHIVEPGLDELLATAVKDGALRATLQPQEADTFVITVPTPVTDDKRADVSYVKSAIESIAPCLRPGNLIIIESTSPVGTTEQAAQWIAALRSDLTISTHGVSAESDIYLAYCPERIMPGQMIRELVENDRVVGGINPRSTELAIAFYKQFVDGECIATTARTAEMTKLTENSFRDVNIAFANELSVICDKQDIDVWELIKLANRHPRVNILQPGAGVGGHCIAVDPWFIVDSNPDEANLIKMARETNDGKSDFVLNKVLSAAEKLEKPIVACLGLSFKKDIDDLRESPALKIASDLAGHRSIELKVVEPHIDNLPNTLVGNDNVTLVELSEAIEQANIIVILVPHTAFANIGDKVLGSKVIIDPVGLIANNTKKQRSNQTIDSVNA